MRQVVFVISDLHLGGSEPTATRAGFQMCPSATHEALARFIGELPPSTSAAATHLVIAGDIVDFLAEEPFASFTVNQAEVREKLRSIFRSTKTVWDALASFVERKGRLKLLLGNHDIELSLPDVRQMLIDRIGPGDVCFLYDNEALTLGPILIEHGNRFDAWNAVPHGALRRIRSQLSRRLPVFPEFPSLPGSRLVVDVMNDLKSRFPFIDLLKPETAAALPLAMALGGVGLKDVWRFFGKFRDQLRVDYDESNQEPTDPDLIDGEALNEDKEWWREAQEIARDNEAPGFAHVDQEGFLHGARLDAVFWAFRKLGSSGPLQRRTFNVLYEEEKYLKPAQRSADAGFRVIVYGHTHLPKRKPLIAADGQPAIYLNTGTWADVMCIPSGIWDEDASAGREVFRGFAGDLGRSTLDRWRRSVPTYARIETSDAEVVDAALLFADDHSVVTTDSLLERLTAKAVA